MSELSDDYDVTLRQLKAARARQKLRLLEEEERAAGRREHLRENIYYGFTGANFGDFVDPMDAFRDPDLRGFSSPFIPAGAGRRDREDGRNRPFVWHDIDLDWMRSQSRWIATKNPLGISAVEAIGDFVIGPGYDYEARPKKRLLKDRVALELAHQVQEVVEEVESFNILEGEDGEQLVWADRERDSVTRGTIDGDVIVRGFATDDGETRLRYVEPEQLRQPPGTGPEWTFGCKNAPGDIERIEAHAVAYDQPDDWEEVPSGEIVHLKHNVPSHVKRGLSDFFATGNAIDETWKLLRNLRVVATVQAAIPWIEEFEALSQATVEAYIESKIDSRRPQTQSPITGRNTNFRKYEAGEIPHISKGRKYVPQPEATNAPNHIAVVQAGMQSILTRWGMPQYFFGDSSNANYASTLVSGSPFVRRVQSRQARYGRFFVRILWMCIRNAAKAGRFRVSGHVFTWQEVSRYIDVVPTPPQVAIADEKQQAEIDHQDIAAGVMSIQTRRAKRNLDDEQERKNLKEEPPTRLQGKVTDLDQQGDPVQPDAAQGQPGAGGQPQPGQQPQAFGESMSAEDLAEWAVALEEGSKHQDGDEWTTNGRKYRRTGGKTVRVGGKTDEGGSEPAGKKDDAALAKAPKGKDEPIPSKPTLDEMHRHVEGLMAAKSKLSSRAAHELAGRLMSLTVAEMHELKRRLGLKASGPKAELATKLATKALQAAGGKPKSGKPHPLAKGGEHTKAHDALKAILGENGKGIDLGDHDAVRKALKKALGGGNEQTGQAAGAGSGRAGEAPAGAGGPVAGEAGRSSSAGADQDGNAGGKPAGNRAAQGVPASLPEVNKRIGRFEQFFQQKGQHHVAEWLGKLKEHVNAVGGEAALKALGEEAVAGGAGDKPVQYWGVGTEEANWKHMGAFMEAYLARNGITAVTGDTSDPDLPLVSALGKPDKYVAGDFKPTNDAFKNKLDEAKHLPGLEKSEDVSTLMGKQVTHLDSDVIKKLNEQYGENTWIVKCYDDNAAAGYGIFFPQRAAKIAEDARNTIWQAGEHLSKYGFQLGRDPKGKVFGIVHETGDVYQFGTSEYEKTIDGDARAWAERAAAAADNEKGARLPEGSFMVQPAFAAVGISDQERAAGKTFHEKNEGRVHLVTRPDGKVEVIPHSTWLKGGNLPVVFEDEDTKAMAQAAQDAISKLPPEARKGQVYAPDVMKTKDGYKVVELNAQGDHNGSGYLHDNHFTIDAYTSHLTGRAPLHVQFIRKLLTSQRKHGS